jgi:hypothetical protein
LNIPIKQTVLRTAGLALALAGVLTATVSAAEAAPAKPAVPISASQCAVHVETGKAKCFGTAREAISYATGGRVTTAPDQLNRALTDSKLATDLNQPAADTLLGIFYYFENYGSPTLYYYGNRGGCSTSVGDVDYGVSPLPVLTYNWNNNIRSFQGYNNCWVKLYDNQLFDGESTGFAGSSADLGWFRDRAESLLFS